MEAEWLNRMNQQKENSPGKLFPNCRHPVSPSPEESKVAQGKPNFELPPKMTKIDQYINSSQAEKNKKLHQIYGEWKVIKRDLNAIEPRYLIPKKRLTDESDEERPYHYRGKRKTHKRMNNRYEFLDRSGSDSEYEPELPYINKKNIQTMR